MRLIKILKNFSSKYVSVKEVENLKSRYYTYQIISMFFGLYVGV